MPTLRFLADIHISPLTVQELRSKGWAVVRVAEVLDKRAPDWEILAFAREDDRIVVTQDLDFSALLAIGGHASPSVITLRLEQPRPAIVARRLIQVISTLGRELASGAAVSVDETSVRYRLLPIDLESD